MSRDARAARDGGGFVPSSFFAFRTPLLPFDDFLAWSQGLQALGTAGDPTSLEQALAADRARLRERLRKLFDRPVIRDALFVASPDLEESLGHWMRDPESERGARIERALVRYFARMAGRPTPFGLFAGSSVGAMGHQTRLVVEEQQKSRRHSRLDMDYLFALADAVGRDPSMRNGFALEPNSSLYRAAGRVHYVEARVDGKDRTHHLVAVEDSDELRATLKRAGGGAASGSLASALVTEEVSLAEAEEYIGQLVESQILCPDLALPVTGCEPVAVLARELRSQPETSPIGDRLEEVRQELSAIDRDGLGAEPARYRAVAQRLETLPAPVEVSRLFQVDMIKSSPDAVLGGAVLQEIVRGVQILRRLAPRRKADDMTRFQEAFAARYEEMEVPLVEALDAETGIGFSPAEDTDTGTLAKGIELPAAAEETFFWGPREKLLLRRLNDAATLGATEVVLQTERLGELESKDPPLLPPAFAVLATIAAASDQALGAGDFRLFVNGIVGPSGARLLGRFCHADPRLRRLVEEHLRAEEALDPDAVFAELVHLPEGRLGNILCRPVLRDYEIPYLGRSGVPKERQIPITDLLISLVGGRFVLRSARLGRRVIPRLTSAHNFAWRGLPLYRFLGELQEQDSAALGWDWGPLWSAPFLPRVVSERLVLSLARWNVGLEELKRIGQSRGAERFRAVQALRERRQLPRLILLADGDNRLPIDLSNVLSVESLVHLIKDRQEATFVEMFPGPEDLCARGPEGRFVHELVVPFVRSTEVATARSGPQSTKRPIPAVARRTFPPGSEWLYAKLYCGSATADGLLQDVVAPLVEDALKSGAADRWFFIRYADPDPHIRLRLHGPAPRLNGEVLPALHAAAARPLDDGRVWKVQLDTYQREVERYGGPEAVELAERIFQADSEAVLEILNMLEEGDAGSEERWRLALRGIDAMLADFGLDGKGKRELVDRARGALLKEMRTGEKLIRGLGDRFRKESRSLELLLDPRHEESPLSLGLAVFHKRSDRLAPLVAELKARDEVGSLSRRLAVTVSSHVHMHVNRMLRSAQRVQEMVLYDFLARLYESRTVRARAQP